MAGANIEHKKFQKRAKNLGAAKFRREGRDWKLTYKGVNITYMVTHGKHAKGNEIPIGGPKGIDHIAGEMAEIAETHHSPHSGDDQYFKQVLKGYKKAEKTLENYIHLLLILSIIVIAFLITIKIML